VVPVFVRVSRFEGPPESVDRAIDGVQERILPAARQMKGFRGLLALVDRSSGKSMGLTFWETEADLLASEEAADRLREEGAESSGERIVGVERYEVVLDAREG
jgi:hypothetical protein